MKVAEQGVDTDGADSEQVEDRPASRYATIPRILILLTNQNPETRARDVLLLRGAPTKRLWANKYNGLGGHVEGDETVYEAALRELEEEAGITDVSLVLRGVVNIFTGEQKDGVMMFVFCGEIATRAVAASAEGMPEWVPLQRLADYDLVDDLYELIPLAVGDATPSPLAGGASQLRPQPNGDGLRFYGHYHPMPDGTMAYHFL